MRHEVKGRREGCAHAFRKTDLFCSRGFVFFSSFVFLFTACHVVNPTLSPLALMVNGPVSPPAPVRATYAGVDLDRRDPPRRTGKPHIGENKLSAKFEKVCIKGVSFRSLVVVFICFHPGKRKRKWEIDCSQSDCVV